MCGHSFVRPYVLRYCCASPEENGGHRGPSRIFSFFLPSPPPKKTKTRPGLVSWVLRVLLVLFFQASALFHGRNGLHRSLDNHLLPKNPKLQQQQYRPTRKRLELLQQQQQQQSAEISFFCPNQKTASGRAWAPSFLSLSNIIVRIMPHQAGWRDLCWEKWGNLMANTKKKKKKGLTSHPASATTKLNPTRHEYHRRQEWECVFSWRHH